MAYKSVRLYLPYFNSSSQPAFIIMIYSVCVKRLSSLYGCILSKKWAQCSFYVLLSMFFFIQNDFCRKMNPVIILQESLFFFTDKQTRKFIICFNVSITPYPSIFRAHRYENSKFTNIFKFFDLLDT